MSATIIDVALHVARHRRTIRNSGSGTEIVVSVLESKGEATAEEFLSEIADFDTDERQQGVRTFEILGDMPLKGFVFGVTHVPPR
jgi:hypothetical protein